MYSIGCDIVAIKRISLKLKDKVLSEKEKQYAKDFNERRMIEFIAGRFAAKEAIIKAVNEPIQFNEIDIQLIDHQLVCTYKYYHIKVSIAHETDTAIAFALCEEKR